MGILTKEVEVKLNGTNVGYYKSLGYKIPMKMASKAYARKNKNRSFGRRNVGNSLVENAMQFWA